MTKRTHDGSANGKVFGLPVHQGRAAALGELHARPHKPIEAPRVLIQLAFMTEGGSAVDHAVLAELARKAGAHPPGKDARRHSIGWGSGTLRWERHTEFSTWLYDGPLDPATGKPSEALPFASDFPAPGTVISAVRLDILAWTDETEKQAQAFDPASLCHSIVRSGRAAIWTDFRQDGDGLTRMLLLIRGLSPQRTGALAQRLVEIESYRVLALLGLPLAQTLSPRLRRTEDRLADITSRMRKDAAEESHGLLSELTELAAELEADAAASLYRFGASRAYDGIVAERLAALDEQAVPGFDTWAAFLRRRLAPAMRTCRSVEERQANLSRKLARTATLLRSWVDVELERQNGALLASMDKRAKMQLLLQQTVEGLSVAAVSYYVVGLVGYLAKGLHLFGVEAKAEYVTAAAVPFVVAFMWWTVRRIRKAHAVDDH